MLTTATAVAKPRLATFTNKTQKSEFPFMSTAATELYHNFATVTSGPIADRPIRGRGSCRVCWVLASALRIHVCLGKPMTVDGAFLRRMRTFRHRRRYIRRWCAVFRIYHPQLFDFWGHAHRLQLEPQIDDENFEATQRLFLWRPHLAWQI